jgi:hypothetical protein
MINADISAPASIFSSIPMLDYYFPFVVFIYGLVINFVLEIPHLVALAKKQMPSQHATFERHRKIAVLSLYVGGLWSLQNIWFS